MIGCERRAWPRRPWSHEHFLPEVRIRPGHQMQVLDVSRGGALIEGAARLTPGSAIELRFIGTDHMFLVRGRIVRCYVAAVTSRGLSYRAAIAFETQLDLTERACSSDG